MQRALAFNMDPSGKNKLEKASAKSQIPRQKLEKVLRSGLYLLVEMKKKNTKNHIL